MESKNPTLGDDMQPENELQGTEQTTAETQENPELTADSTLAQENTAPAAEPVEEAAPAEASDVEAAEPTAEDEGGTFLRGHRRPFRPEGHAQVGLGARLQGNPREPARRGGHAPAHQALRRDVGKKRGYA